MKRVLIDLSVEFYKNRICKKENFRTPLFFVFLTVLLLFFPFATSFRLSTWDSSHRRASVVPLTAEAGDYRDPFAVALNEFSTSIKQPSQQQTGAGGIKTGNGPQGPAYASRGSAMPSRASNQMGSGSPAGSLNSVATMAWAPNNEPASPIYDQLPGAEQPYPGGATARAVGTNLDTSVPNVYAQPTTIVGSTNNGDKDFGVTAVEAWNKLSASTGASNSSPTPGSRPASDKSVNGVSSTGGRQGVSPLESASATSMKPSPPTTMPPAIVSLWARRDSETLA